MGAIIRFEHTDTFSGEANYSWVNRGVYEGKRPDSELSVIRAAKAFAGFTGIRCRVEKYGDMIALYPSGICQVCFVTWGS